jgi:hypothetical protein
MSIGYQAELRGTAFKSAGPDAFLSYVRALELTCMAQNGSRTALKMLTFAAMR